MKKLHHHKNTQSKSGFTIVEVTLVTAFVAMLLIAISTVIMSISAIFQKGLTLKGVNTVGRNLITELTTAINAAPSIDSASLCNMYATTAASTEKQDCLQNAANKYIFQEKTGGYRDPRTNTTSPVQYYGIFCTGNYSYIWNTYYGVQANETIRLQYLDKNGNRHTIPEDYSNDEPLRLVRFEDKTYHACTQNVTSDYRMKNGLYGDSAGGSSNLELNMTQLDNGQLYKMQTEPQQGFLESSDSDVNLDLYELVIFPPSQDMVTLRAFFAGTFILATNNGDVNIMRGGDYCDPGGAGLEDGQTSSNLFDLGSGFNYCGINKFNFAARTAGSGI